MAISQETSVAGDFPPFQRFGHWPAGTALAAGDPAGSSAGGPSSGRDTGVRVELDTGVDTGRLVGAVAGEGARKGPELLILCDHARNTLPAGHGSLGLTPDHLARHIAYDIGAEGVCRVLADAFGAPGLLAAYSRLLIDPNRGHDDPTLIMRYSDGAVIPGNRSLSDAERAHRLNAFHAPYHDAISAHLDARVAAGATPVLISVHSFTPVWRGQPRPWEIGILWDRDDRIAAPLIAHLRAQPDLTVGDNEPYVGRLEGDCMNRHGTKRGLPHVLIEVRQDLIADAAGQERWGRRLADALEAVLKDRRDW